jgi:hypothetical protein
MYLWCWDYLADKKKVVDFRSSVAGLRRKSRGVERIPRNSFDRKYSCKTAAILLSNTSFTHRGNYGFTTWTKRGAASHFQVLHDRQACPATSKPESGKLFAGQTPRVSSSNIPVFHPDRLQMVSNNMIPQYHLHFLRTMRLHLDLNATPAANSS